LIIKRKVGNEAEKGRKLKPPLSGLEDYVPKVAKGR